METFRVVTPKNLEEILPQLWKEVCQHFEQEGTKLTIKVKFVSPVVISLYTLDRPPAYHMPGVGILLDEEETITVGILAHELAHCFTSSEYEAQQAELAVGSMISEA